jgi:hypothetical protein
MFFLIFLKNCAFVENVCVSDPCKGNTGPTCNDVCLASTGGMCIFDICSVHDGSEVNVYCFIFFFNNFSVFL